MKARTSRKAAFAATIAVSMFFITSCGGTSDDTTIELKGGLDSRDCSSLTVTCITSDATGKNSWPNMRPLTSDSYEGEVKFTNTGDSDLNATFVVEESLVYLGTDVIENNVRYETIGIVSSGETITRGIKGTYPDLPSGTVSNGLTGVVDVRVVRTEDLLEVKEVLSPIR